MIAGESGIGEADDMYADVNAFLAAIIPGTIMDWKQIVFVAEVDENSAHQNLCLFIRGVRDGAGAEWLSTEPIIGAGDLFLDTLKRTVKARALHTASTSVEIKLSQLGDTTAALGAAVLILKSVFNPTASVRN